MRPRTRVKINAVYYREVALRQILLPDIRASSGNEFFVFQQDSNSASKTKFVALLDQETPDFIAPSHWPPNSPVDYSMWSSVGIDLKEPGVRCRNVWNFAQGLTFKADFHSKMSVCRHERRGGQPPTPLPQAISTLVWSVLRERVYRTIISDVNELKRNINSEWVAVNHTRLLNLLLASVVSVYLLACVRAGGEADILSTCCNEDDVTWHVRLFWETMTASRFCRFQLIIQMYT